MVRLAAFLCLCLALPDVLAATPRSDLLSPCNKEVDARIQHLIDESFCGKVEVFENRATGQGRKISLNVMVIPARISKPAPDPIFFLAGGPGQSAVKTGPFVFRQLSSLSRDRDIVLVDQRGTGSSNSLACNNVLSNHAFSVTLAEAMETQLGTLKKCLTTIKADTTQYTTPIAMDDLNEVRQVLGYDQINLVGISYGTRAALVYVRRHPDTVRTMTLDAVAPTTMVIPANVAVDAQAAFDQVVKDCHEDAGCQDAFPKLAEHLNALISRLEIEPELIHFTHPLTGKKLEAYLEAPLINRLIRSVLYDRTLSRLLPLAIEEAYKKNYTPFITFGFLNADEDMALSAGMMASVLCAEDMQLVTEEFKAAQFDNPLTEILDSICTFWPHTKVSKDYFEPVQTNVPTLLLSGKLDPITPPRYAKETHAFLANAEHIIVPGAGHSTLLNGCIPRIVQQFIEGASVQGINTSCADNILRPPFFTDFSGAGYEGDNKEGDKQEHESEKTKDIKDD